MSDTPLTIRFATRADVGTILQFICLLADYEKLRHEVVASEESLLATLFGERPAAEVLIAELPASGTNAAIPVGFALFFQSYSTFLAQPGIYLEDLFVDPTYRGRGYGLALMAQLASVAVDRGCGRFEWSVLDWNTPAIDFYRQLGAKPQDEWTVQRLTGDALRALASRGLKGR